MSISTIAATTTTTTTTTTTIACSTSPDSQCDNITTTNKRKRQNHREEEPSTTIASDIDRRPFSIRSEWSSFSPSTSASDPFAQPRIFSPQCLLGRALLPLAYFDTAQEGSRLFTAHVHVLEASHDYHDATNVLIVEDHKSGRLYAVERVQRHKYALCRLAEHVSRDDLLARAAHRAPIDVSQRKRQALQPTSGKQPWWAKAAVQVEHSAQGMSSAALPLFTGLQRSLALEASPARPMRPAQDLEVPESEVIELAPLEGTGPETSMTSDHIFEELSRQYLEALYLSRTPLAYFVKGPLARARAAMATRPLELVTFLRGALLTSPGLDKKFRAALPDIVKEIPMIDTPATQSKARRKRKWKAKRDKQGLFVDEKEYIEQWWRKGDGHPESSALNESHEAEIKRRTQLMRNRETFLQVIIILEILALEAVPSQPPASSTVAEADRSAVAAGGAAEPDKKQRKKKEVDANGVLETLVERLNIFHTVEFSPVKTKEGENGSSQPDTKDELKNFATEVVIPFFASRVHEISNTVSKKLGGPSAPRQLEKKSINATRKPGEPTTRLPPEKKPRRPLGRTSTDTLNRSSKQPPVLLRSATDQDALAPLIKREMSETPSLHEVAAAKISKAAPKKRATGLDQYAASHRQIDLSAMSQANETRIRKNKDVEDKILRDALNGIRKPNRALATAEAARNADESFARALSRSKPKVSRPQSHRNGETRMTATITATPKHIKATPAPRRQLQHSSGTPSGSTAVVPSTTGRHLAAPDQIPNSDFAVPQTGHRLRLKNVAETPSRGFAKFMPLGLAREPGTLIESPTLSRNIPGLATPSRPLRMPSLAETPLSKLPSSVDPIPLMSPAAAIQRDDSGLGLASSASKDTTSIYAKLGWNDDDADFA
ncbi:Putative DNA replication regulator Sld3 [Septoria linicola]|uniref:DNA replication regulator Sld3 n=1 Tax=Septoria linicola TaxID=215465 RepID=A0A9Q9ADX1_9PEZI|nr:Putative DNA replication regulator Sld3 [Septoria linicola]